MALDQNPKVPFGIFGAVDYHPSLFYRALEFLPRFWPMAICFFGLESNLRLLEFFDATDFSGVPLAVSSSKEGLLAGPPGVLSLRFFFKHEIWCFSAWPGM